MDLGAVAKSPIVWVAGVGLGLIILATRGGGGSASSSGPSAGAWAAYNAEAFQSVDTQAQIAGNIGVAQIGADVQKQGQVLGFLSTLAQVQGNVQAQMIQANAGVAQSQMTTQASIIIDQANNANRAELANINAGVSYAQIKEMSHASDNALSAAKAQASAQSLGSVMGAISGIGQSVVKYGLPF